MFLEKDASRRPSAAEAETILLEEMAATKKEGGRQPQSSPPPSVFRSVVGREHERVGFRTAFESVKASRGLILCVTGNREIGKTTLVEDLLAELLASPQPCRIARGRCSERLAGAEAYLPWLEALDSLRSR